jgi:hypothetical protein
MLYIRIFGKEEELAETMQALKDNGFTFTLGEVHEFKSPCHKETPFGCDLHDFCAPAMPTPLLKTATSTGFLGVGIFWLAFDWLLVSYITRNSDSFVSFFRSRLK